MPDVVYWSGGLPSRVRRGIGLPYGFVQRFPEMVSTILVTSHRDRSRMIEIRYFETAGTFGWDPRPAGYTH